MLEINTSSNGAVSLTTIGVMSVCDSLLYEKQTTRKIKTSNTTKTVKFFKAILHSKISKKNMLLYMN